MRGAIRGGEPAAGAETGEVVGAAAGARAGEAAGAAAGARASEAAGAAAGAWAGEAAGAAAGAGALLGVERVGVALLLLAPRVLGVGGVVGGCDVDTLGTYVPGNAIDGPRRREDKGESFDGPEPCARFLDACDGVDGAGGVDWTGTLVTGTPFFDGVPSTARSGDVSCAGEPSMRRTGDEARPVRGGLSVPGCPVSSRAATGEGSAGGVGTTPVSGARGVSAAGPPFTSESSSCGSSIILAHSFPIGSDTRGPPPGMVCNDTSGS